MKSAIGIRVIRMMRREGKRGIGVVRGEVVTMMGMTSTRMVRHRIEVITIETERRTERGTERGRGIEEVEAVKGEEKMIMVLADVTIGTFPYSVLTLPGTISRTETQRAGEMEDRGTKEIDSPAETETEKEKEVEVVVEEEEEGIAVLTGIGTGMIGVIEEEQMMLAEEGMETKVEAEVGVEVEVEKEVEDEVVTVMTVDHGLDLIPDRVLGPGHHRGPVGVIAGVTVRVRVWTAEMRRKL